MSTPPPPRSPPSAPFLPAASTTGLSQSSSRSDEFHPSGEPSVGEHWAGVLHGRGTWNAGVSADVPRGGRATAPCGGQPIGALTRCLDQRGDVRRERGPGAVKPATWLGYVSRGQAPSPLPARDARGRRLWSAQQVRGFPRPGVGRSRGRRHARTRSSCWPGCARWPSGWSGCAPSSESCSWPGRRDGPGDPGHGARPGHLPADRLRVAGRRRPRSADSAPLTAATGASLTGVARYRSASRLGALASVASTITSFRPRPRSVRRTSTAASAWPGSARPSPRP